MTFKTTAVRIHWILSTQFGIDPVKLILSLRGLPLYLRDLFRFRSKYDGPIELKPCLHDRYEEGGTTRSEYFWQDLIVAKKIYEAGPRKHVDIGSRVDGLVAHVASFRNIEVFDVRPITSDIPGVTFKQADIMNPEAVMGGYCDSLSCLHALEHFGLGRYGDPVDSEGFIHGFVNMAKMLRKKGLFYLSVPVGIARVEFNANHVFDPRIILDLSRQNSLKLSDFIVIGRHGGIEMQTTDEAYFSELANQRYALGIFTFVKL